MKACTQVRKLSKRMASLSAAPPPLPLRPVRVTAVERIGPGDRVCVDLSCLMRPGEGLLVGSFAAGLFLVHSECEESQYINSRPFRVNAGPVGKQGVCMRGRL
jgi:3-dehydroquinate synthase class II